MGGDRNEGGAVAWTDSRSYALNASPKYNRRAWPAPTMPAVLIEDFQARDTDALVRMWRESFEHGVGIVDPNPIEAQVAYFNDEVLPGHRVRVARSGEGRIVGFIAANGESVAQLHVRVAHIRQGIGRLLLDLAKAESTGSLWLFTFQRNRRACAFYESQGFEVVQRGFEPTWQLDDVKYLWTRVGAASGESA
jgi:ribosomal protein S18 acetylase RimI-like enzyme